MSSPETPTAAARAPNHPAAAEAQHPPWRIRHGRTWPALLICAVLFGALATLAGTHRLGWSPVHAVSAVALAVQALLAVPIAVIDLRHHRIPNPIVATVAAVSLSAAATHPALLAPALIAAASVGLGLFALNLLGGLGMGDVKLAAACAMAWGLHGPSIVMLALAAGFALALPATLITMARGDRRRRIPLGPWLIAGSVLTLTWSLIQ